MNADRELQILCHLPFQLYHDGDRAGRNLTHSIVIEVGIIGRSSHTILDFINTDKEYNTILYLYITTVADCIDTIMTSCTFHILLIFEKKQVLTLMCKDSGGDTILLDSCFIDRPQTINHVAQVVHRDNGGWLRHRDIICSYIQLQAIQILNLRERNHGPAQIYIVLSKETITSQILPSTISLLHSQSTEPTVSRYSVFCLYFPGIHTIKYLDVTSSTRTEIHTALSLLVRKVTILCEIHKGTRVRSSFRTLTVLEDKLAFLCRYNLLDIEIGREEATVYGETAIIHLALVVGIRSVRVFNISIDTSTNIAYR